MEQFFDHCFNSNNAEEIGLMTVKARDGRWITRPLQQHTEMVEQSAIGWPATRYPQDLDLLQVNSLSVEEHTWWSCSILTEGECLLRGNRETKQSPAKIIVNVHFNSSCTCWPVSQCVLHIVLSEVALLCKDATSELRTEARWKLVDRIIDYIIHLILSIQILWHN